jgi:ribose transport system ATP-binding protein
VLKDINLSVRKGEIVGITGLMGAGKTELGRATASADPIDSGQIFVHGKKTDCSSPEKAINHGVAYLPEDRKT